MRTLLIAVLLVGVAGAQTHCQCNSDKPPVNSFLSEVYTTVPPPTDCRKGFHLACYDDAPKVEPKPEAMDVPAILLLKDYTETPFEVKCHATHHTCIDRRRILEHDEQNPPKYWCHKTQPDVVVNEMIGDPDEQPFVGGSVDLKDSYIEPVHPKDIIFGNGSLEAK